MDIMKTTTRDPNMYTMDRCIRMQRPQAARFWY